MVRVTFDTFYSGKTTVLINKGRYAENKTTALIATCDDPQNNYEEPWGTVSVNLGIKLDDDEIFADINNNESLVNEMVKQKLLIPTGITQRSGFVEYPLMKLGKELQELSYF